MKGMIKVQLWFSHSDPGWYFRKSHFHWAIVEPSAQIRITGVVLYVQHGKLAISLCFIFVFLKVSQSFFIAHSITINSWWVNTLLLKEFYINIPFSGLTQTKYRLSLKAFGHLAKCIIHPVVLSNLAEKPTSYIRSVITVMYSYRQDLLLPVWKTKKQ